MKAEQPKKSEDRTGRDRLPSNILYGWGGYLVFVVAGFIMPRAIDQHLGQFSLGIWDFCWSLVTYLRFSGMGIGSSTNRYVAKYRAANDAEGLGRAISSVMCIQAVIALVVFLASAAIALSLPFLFSDRLGEELRSAQWVVLALGSTLAARVAFNAFHGVLTGCHRWDLYNGITAASYALTVALMMAALVLGGGLRSLAAIYLGVSLLTEALQAALSYRVCPELRIRWADASWAQGKKMVVFGAKTILSSLPLLVVVQTTNIFVAAVMGPAALAMFARPVSLVRHLETFMQKFSFVLTPTAGSLQGQRDAINDLLIRFSRYGVALTLPAVIGMVIYGDLLLELWMGPDYAHGLPMAILALGYLLPISQNSIIRILIGINLHGRIGMWSLTATLATFGAGLLIVQTTGWNLTAAALLVAIPLTVGHGIFVPVYACRKLGIPLAQYIRQVFAEPLLCGGLLAAWFLLVRLLFESRIPATLGVGITGGGLLTAALYWHFIVPDELRGRIKRWLDRRMRLKPSAVRGS